MAYRYSYSSSKTKKPLSKKEKAKRKRQREVNKIYSVWTQTKHMYAYKHLDEPPYNKDQAEELGMSVYWGICKFGHVGERSVKKSSCLACEKITRSTRNARIRGAIKLKLSREEKARIAEIYNEARYLTEETGVEHHVDHIRPIAAGGLHHPDNLQVITAKENISKGSTFQGKRRKYSRKEKLEQREAFKTKQVARMKYEKPKEKISINWYFWGLVAAGLWYFFM